MALAVAGCGRGGGPKAPTLDGVPATLASSPRPTSIRTRRSTPASPPTPGRARPSPPRCRSNSSYLGGRIAAYFDNLLAVSTTLGEMADLQRQGLPHKPEHLAFINRAVNTEPVGCAGPPGLRGWYADLFFDPNSALEFSPTIADVHTQPTDEGGTPVGHVLHVGTGWVRLMVTTVDSCAGPRAYAGVAFSYHEVVTDNLRRLDDKESATRFGPTSAPDDVSATYS